MLNLNLCVMAIVIFGLMVSFTQLFHAILTPIELATIYSRKYPYLKSIIEIIFFKKYQKREAIDTQSIPLAYISSITPLHSTKP